jgi:hypothetical protein
MNQLEEISLDKYISEAGLLCIPDTRETVSQTEKVILRPTDTSEQCTYVDTQNF